LFDPWAIASFNIVFTSLPVLALGVLDRDVRRGRLRDTTQFPELYDQGRMSELFNMRTYTMAVTAGLFHSAMCFFIPMLIVWDADQGSYAWLSVTSYTAVVWVCTVKCSMMSTSWTIPNIVLVVLSILSWYLFLVAYGEIFSPSLLGVLWYRAYRDVLSDPVHWLALILCIAVCNCREFLWKFYERNYRPQLAHQIAKMDNEASTFDTGKPGELGDFNRKVFEDDPKLRKLLYLSREIPREPDRGQRLDMCTPHTGGGFVAGYEGRTDVCESYVDAGSRPVRWSRVSGRALSTTVRDMLGFDPSSPVAGDGDGSDFLSDQK